jgi:hypothetical protein
MENSNLAMAAARDAGGRFLPGRSGNPAGKKPGTRNRATEIRAMLAEGEEMAVARTVIDKATSGDAVAARFLLGLLCPRPRPRGRAIALALPDGARAGDTVAAFNATLQAMAAGEITPDEAVTVTRMLDGRLEALNAFKLQRELTRYRGDFIRGDELFRPAEEQFREPGVVEEAGEDEGADELEPSPACGRGQGEGSRETDDDCDDSKSSSSPHPISLPQAGEGMTAAETGPAVDTQTEPSPACSQRGFATPDAAAGTCGPRESGRGQGEGSRGVVDRHDSMSSGGPHPNPLPQAGEGMVVTDDEDLHSACIELDVQAEAAARQAAQRKLAQWGYLIRTQPGFSEESFIAAEIQRSAALKRSSASLPGHSSRSPSALNGVATVLR